MYSRLSGITAEEFIALLEETCTPIGDDVLEGDKFYYKWQVDSPSLIHGRKMQLSSYRGKMGAGVVNAARLLEKIKTGGVAMEFPNLFINTGSNSVVDPSAYLAGDSFSVEIADPGIVTVSTGSGEASGSVTAATGTLTFHALRSGSTTGTITTSAGVSQTFAITVRATGSGSDWL